jgi:tetratricopeptide (TPR) repeat protein
MKIPIKLVLLLLLICSNIIAQEMTKGFKFLENGNFNDAEIFFKNILNDFPSNKTALVCYGRAIGLNGKPAKANDLFSELMKQYPNDLEIELNYAESLLWNKAFQKAKVFYQQLVQSNPTNFNALLGYANTFSNLKEYDSALNYVNKALTVSPNNPSALISRKYINLGYANEFVQQQDYKNALAFLENNLIDFPNDKETLLNKATIFLITKNTLNATAVYNQLAYQSKDSLITFNGLALVEHLKNKDKRALKFAIKAKNKLQQSTDSILTIQTLERYTQALIWNKKYKKAEQHINALFKTYGKSSWIFSLRATLAIYKSNFKNAINDYTNILTIDSLSFDGNLGIANAYYASGQVLKAYDGGLKTLTIFKDQPDATNFLKKLNKEYSPIIESKSSFSFDNGHNQAYTSNVGFVLPISTKISVNTLYEYRKTENTVLKNEATLQNFQLGFQYQLFPKITFNSKFGFTDAQSFSKQYNQFLGEISFNIKAIKLQDIEIGIKKDIQNFNASLIDEKIAGTNYFLNYNLSTNFNIGWFTQYFYTTQSDKNSRNLLFTSVYHNLFPKPAFKYGVNFQFLNFKNQVPSIYFSPEKFKAIELFIDLLKDENIANTNEVFYSLNAATGFQYIENDPKQSTYRVQAKIGYKFSDQFIANFYGLRSNIASATAAGFTYNEIGFRLKWHLDNCTILTKKSQKQQ